MSCGGCTLCCTLMKVTSPELEKPAGETCVHCTRGGCGIYADRPEPCRVFECLWLASQERLDARMQSGLRPDRCGVVMELNTAGNIIAHCATPDAWKRSPINAKLLKLAARTKVLIEHGNEQVFLLHPSGRLEQLAFLDIDEQSNERRYVTQRRPVPQS